MKEHIDSSHRAEASTVRLASQLLELLKDDPLKGQWMVEAWAPDGERYASEFFATSIEAELAKALMQYLSIHEESWEPVAHCDVRPAPQGTRVILTLE
jgi:hypothetical protein